MIYSLSPVNNLHSSEYIFDYLCFIFVTRVLIILCLVSFLILKCFVAEGGVTINNYNFIRLINIE